MTKRSNKSVRGPASAALFAALCVAQGCGEDIPRSEGRGAAASAAAPAAPTASAKKEREPLVFKDEDFVQSLRNRDPFHSYTMSFRARMPEEMQRRVIMPTVPVEEMRLIAIVSGMPKPKAMLVDPSGVGYVVERGDYVGRPKMIQATGSVSMTLNWRVDRIRDNEVVLTQQDPADPNRAALTKIILLNDEVAQK